MHHLSRGQGEEQGIPIRPVAAPEVEQPLLLQAVVGALRQAGQHVECQRASPLLAQENKGQACSHELPYRTVPEHLFAGRQVAISKDAREVGNCRHGCCAGMAAGLRESRQNFPRF